MPVVVVGGSPGRSVERVAGAVGREQVRRRHDRIEVVVDRWVRGRHVVVDPRTAAVLARPAGAGGGGGGRPGGGGGGRGPGWGPPTGGGRGGGAGGGSPPTPPPKPARGAPPPPRREHPGHRPRPPFRGLLRQMR